MGLARPALNYARYVVMFFCGLLRGGCKRSEYTRLPPLEMARRKCKTISK